MNRLIFFLLFSSLMLCAPLGMKRMTHGFRLEKLQLDFPFRPEWEIPPLDPQAEEELSAVLNQSFHYLDRGAQCYVFLSRDGHYVLKLFRYDSPLNPVRSFFRAHFRISKPKTPFYEKIEKLFSACALAYALGREETALFYLHLNLTKNSLPSLKIKTALGQTYTLPLDRYRFALQRKGEPLYKALLKGDRIQVKKRLLSLIDLLKRRTAKGIANSDPNLCRNFGFIGDRAFELDFGNYAFSRAYLLDPAQREREIKHYLSLLRLWLVGAAPEWVSLVDEEMDK